MRNKNYWCYRINNQETKFFNTELYEGRLRQGWGYDNGQDLRNFTVDEGAGRNRSMFNNVKKNDIILIPHLPNWDEVAIAVATEDWNIGYRFEIDNKLGDYGHIFPAKLLKHFTRYNENVTGNLRSTLHNPSRFWNINHYFHDVVKLLELDQSELSKYQTYESRFDSTLENVYNNSFDDKKFTEELYIHLSSQFTREEWEHLLVIGFKAMFPFYEVERSGGTDEENHGTDILIKIPGVLTNYQYAIAIQVKDYEGFVGEGVINQICKADSYWNKENLLIIEKIVIITRAEKDFNLKLLENDKNVKFVFANDLKLLLSEIGKKYFWNKLSKYQ